MGEIWQGSSLRGLKRTVSDRCAIVLDSKEEDWGLKPFSFLNAWMSHPSFMEVVDVSWTEGGMEG